MVNCIHLFAHLENSLASSPVRTFSSHIHLVLQITHLISCQCHSYINMLNVISYWLPHLLLNPLHPHLTADGSMIHRCTFPACLVVNLWIAFRPPATPEPRQPTKDLVSLPRTIALTLFYISFLSFLSYVYLLYHRGVTPCHSPSHHPLRTLFGVISNDWTWIRSLLFEFLDWERMHTIQPSCKQWATPLHMAMTTTVST